MCQIHAINRTSWDLNTNEITRHLQSASYINDHGSAAIFIDAMGEHSIIRSMDFDVILDMMTINDKWETVIIHQRYTTQGDPNLNNTHMWQVGNFWYCHNGVLSSKRSAELEVDSMVIGECLERGDVWEAISYCQSEDYANVFIVNLIDKQFIVTRSKTNTLYTDGNGQYSTTKLAGIIEEPVSENSVRIHELDVNEPDWGYEDARFYMELTYEERAARASGGRDTEGTTDMSIEIEEYTAKAHQAQADGDDIAYNHYNYLLERANGNG